MQRDMEVFPFEPFAGRIWELPQSVRTTSVVPLGAVVTPTARFRSVTRPPAPAVAAAPKV